MSVWGAAGLINLSPGAFRCQFESSWAHRFISRCISVSILGAAGFSNNLKVHFDVSFGSCWAHRNITRCISMSVLGAAGLIELSQGAFR